MKKLKHHKARLKRRITRISSWLMHTSLPEILLTTNLIWLRWLQNFDNTYPHEMFLPTIIFAVLGTIVFYVYKLVLRKDFQAHVAALALTYFGLYVYSFTAQNWFGRTVLRLIPGQWATPFTQSISLVLVLAVVFGGIAYGIGWLIEKYELLQQFQLRRVLYFAVVFVFSVTTVRVTARLLRIHSELSYRYDASSILNQKPATSPSTKPNIYFLMYEDYADESTLQTVNNYSIAPLLNYLSGQGFTNHQPVLYSNYPFTTSSLSSMLAMNYFPELQQKFGKDGNLQTAFPYRSVINNPPIAQVLKQNGYTYNQLSSWWENSRVNIQADKQPTKGYRLTLFGKQFYQGDLGRDIVFKSILQPWLKKGMTIGHSTVAKYDLDYNPPQNLDVQIKALKDIAAHSSTGSPQFTFGHFMLPHTPYIFNADGTTADYDGDHNDNDVPENQKYANQVAYLNTLIEDMIGYIREKDSSAVVIIQSDEGSYPPQFRYTQTPSHYFDPINLPVPQMQQKFGIFASYYLPGVDTKTTLKNINSPVNAFRFTLNQYLDYNLPLLPDCQFATGNKYVLYDYTLVTGQLNGNPEPEACKQYQ